MARVRHPFEAFLAALGAVALLSVMDAVMKHLVLAIGILSVSVWRSIVSLGFASVLYLPRRRAWPNRRTLRIHLVRGALVMGLAFLFFWGISRVPLAQGIALTFIAPLLALILAGVFLDEQIGPRSIAGSIAAFGGVLVIIFGQATARLGPGVLLGTAAILGSALCYAGNLIMMRRQALAAKPLEINFFQALTITVLWLMILPFIGLPQSLGEEWPWVGVAAVLSTCGTLLYGWAYARGEASYLAACEYSAFLWASVLGWLVFQERVSFDTLAGAVLIVGGCLIAASRKTNGPPEIDLA